MSNKHCIALYDYGALWTLVVPPESLLMHELEQVVPLVIWVLD